MTTPSRCGKTHAPIFLYKTHHLSRQARDRIAEPEKEDVLSSSSEQRREMLSQIDLDGGGGRAAELPLAELERAVVGHFSDRSWDGTCQAAFAQACDSVMHADVRSDDAPASYLWIQRAAFLPFLHHLVYFANHWHKFQRIGAELLSESERGGNGRLMLNDFLRAAAMVGTPVSKADAKEAFDGITRSDDGSGGGGVPFNEFCRWCAHHHISQLPHDHNDEVLERIYIGRRFRNDTERLEKLFEMYTKMTTKVSA